MLCRITPAGLELLGALDGLVEASDPGAIADLSDEETATMTALLACFI